MKKNDSTTTQDAPMTEEALDTWLEENDVGSLLENVEPQLISPKSQRMGRPRIGKKITLTLPEETIEALRIRAAKKGLGYQTYARMILMSIKDDEAS